MKPIHALTAVLLLSGSLAHAVLPPPSPAQAQAAADKKAAADAQAARDKAALLASMDAVSARWRSRAAHEGWKVNPPTALPPAPPPAPAAAAPAAAAPAAAAGKAPVPAAKPAPPGATR